MNKPLVKWEDGSGGLWLLGAKEDSPPGTLRRAKGLHPVRGRSLRSRNGHRAIVSSGITGDINAVTYFAGSYWVGTSEGILYRVTDGVATSIKEGLDGTPLRFLITPPVGGLPDQLFVSGGGFQLFKVDEDGNVKPWGIEPPPDGFKVAALDPRVKVITDTTQFSTTNPPDQFKWGSVEIQHGGEVVLSASDLEPSTALKMTSKPGRLAHVTRRFQTDVDLTTFEDSTYDKFPGSSDIDYITLRVWVDLPNYIDFFQIALDCGVNFNSDFYTALVTVKPKTGLSIQDSNVKSVTELLKNVQKRATGGPILGPNNPLVLNRVKVRETAGEAEILPFFAPTQIELAARVWSEIKIPRTNFHRSGINEAVDFSTIRGASLYYHTRKVDPETGQIINDDTDIEVHFQDFQLEGGYGTKGPTYFFQLTYRDSETGNRSNPNPTPVAVPQATSGVPNTSIDRNPFLLTKLPSTVAPEGADEIEEWRTLGDGSDLFLAQRVKIADLATARDFGLNAREMFDGVPDIYDFNRREPVPGEGDLEATPGALDLLNFSNSTQATNIQVGDELTVEGETYTVLGKPLSIQAKVDRALPDSNTHTFEWLSGLVELGALDPVSLPLDNIAPEQLFDDVTFHGGRAWWISREQGKRGRLYFAPQGRPESVADFRLIANDSEESQRILTWNGSLWLFTQAKIYQVESENDPVLLREVAGSPGTDQPDTVVETRIGIVYQTKDGVYIFDGTDSRAIDLQADGKRSLHPVFNGETVEGIAAFDGTYASCNGMEYLITDGVTSLAVNLDTREWREVGSALGAIAYVEEQKITVAGVGSTLIEFEAEGELTDPADAAIPLSWEVPQVEVENGERVLVRRVSLDLNTGGERLTPTLLLDDTEVTLPPIATATRSVVELAVSRECQRVGVRLSGSVRASVEWFDVDVDGRGLGGVG